MKTHFTTFILFLIYYLIWSFGMWDWISTSSEWPARFFFILLSTIPTWICIYLYSENPDWLKSKPHEEKITWIRKYIWELHEELKLYWEAMDLQKRINEFKKQK